MTQTILNITNMNRNNNSNFFLKVTIIKINKSIIITKASKISKKISKMTQVLKKKSLQH